MARDDVRKAWEEHLRKYKDRYTTRRKRLQIATDARTTEEHRARWEQEDRDRKVQKEQERLRQQDPTYGMTGKEKRAYLDQLRQVWEDERLKKYRTQQAWRRKVFGEPQTWEETVQARVEEAKRRQRLIDEKYRAEQWRREQAGLRTISHRARVEEYDEQKRLREREALSQWTQERARQEMEDPYASLTHEERLQRDQEARDAAAREEERAYLRANEKW